MPVAREAPCSPWTSVEAVLAWPSVCGIDPLPDALVVANMIDVAGALLYERSGRRWPGLCTSTAYIEPRCGCPRSAGWCGHWWTCNRPSGPAIRVGHSPLRTVTSITSDGDTVDAGNYRIEDGRYIVRTDDERWTGELVVVYTHGIDPPAPAELAARVLAAELLTAAVPGAACRLPRRAQSAARQGVTVAFVDPQDFFGEGRTGLYEVDLWLSTLPKPAGTRRSRVILPGHGQGVTRR